MIRVSKSNNSGTCVMPSASELRGTTFTGAFSRSGLKRQAACDCPVRRPQMAPDKDDYYPGVSASQ